MLLNIVGVGPQRTGTTWLYEHLRKHPELCFPKNVKETFFLDENFEKGWQWYWRHFQHQKSELFCGEIGPTDFDIIQVSDRIKEHNPECRIIINLRDPVSRSFSLYLHHRQKGRLNCDFQKAIRKMPRIIYSSYYRIHLRRWFNTFGSDQIHILLLDDISTSPKMVLENMCKFIGIARITAPDLVNERINAVSLPAYPALAGCLTKWARSLRNKRGYSLIEFGKMLGLKRLYTGYEHNLPTLDKKTWNDLLEEFEPDIEYVENLVGRSLPQCRMEDQSL